MKKHFFLASLMVSSMAFGQATTNQSIGLPAGIISNPIPQQFSGSEIFRFRAGIVTQLQSGSAFDFTNSEWFGLGKVSSGSQTFYGLRFQQPNRGLIMGYTSASANNPRIEWIGNSLSGPIGNLEFRVGDGFGGPPSPGAPSVPGVNTLVASMTPQGNSYFGNANPSIFSSLNPKVGIGFSGLSGLQISSNGTLGSSINPTGARIEVFYSGNTGTGLFTNVSGGQFTTALFGKADGQQSSIGVFGGTPTNTAFSAAIYGDASATGSNLHAGFFN